ncbi:MAG: glycoside hydrolase [Verrucomicrobiota bacterium]|jgi:hypothetical protein
MKTILFTALAWIALTAALRAQGIANGGFESGLTGWRPLWTRTAEAGTLSLDRETVHTGRNAARVEHRGEQDWSLEPEQRIAVNPGDVFAFDAWLKLESRGGSATLCVSTWDREGHAADWSFGTRTLSASGGWQRVRSRFVVPDNIAQIQPRLIGNGPATVWADDFVIERTANVNALRRPDLPATLTLSNATLTVSLNTATATLAVLDRRTGRRVEQTALHRDLIVTNATATRSGIEMALLDASSGRAITGRIQLDPAAPEFTFDLAGEGELPGALRFPHPFAARAGEYLVVPMNEGISYPVDDPSITALRLIAYGGHGICMAFWGATDGAAGQMAIIETPDDAAIHIQRADRRLVIAPEWDAQHGAFGYARRLRYVFFDRGGHVAMAKRYRAYAQQIGRFKTLAQKRAENPNVDLLIGAVNVWCWDRDGVGLAKELQAAGIARILWSNQQSPENLRALNDLGVLTSRYDIYQDLMDPANFPKLAWQHSDWTTAGWPNDIIRDAAGNWQRGWAVEGRDGGWYSCGVLCDRRALDYARERIPADLATHPYRCRFIDTTTAAPWNECYQTNHPMTRTDSREWKMKLLDYVSRDNHLVTGCETGHDAAVPFLHYFEGMLSLGPYRVPDAGRDMARIWTNAPEAVVKFQLGHAYRLPLWELVYHECVVAQWYWGDYNNKLPMLWDKRDLFNALYATPPMFMFNRRLWRENRDRFVQSYRTTCPWVQEVGYSEMTDHRFLTPDRNVQQTAFANGRTITVNFGSEPFKLPDGRTVAGMGFQVD